MNADQLAAMVLAIRRAVEAGCDRLNALDSALGDGDHGSSLAKGFKAATRQVSRLHEATPSIVLKTTALALTNTMGGAAGALYGTLFLRASTAIAEKSTLSARDLAIMWKAGVDAVMQRGKAKPGDKTMVDALLPAVRAFDAAVCAGHSLGDAFTEAASAAERGAEETAGMVARHGRAKFTGERSREHIDAGAASTALMFGAMRDYWIGVEDDEV